MLKPKMWLLFISTIVIFISILPSIIESNVLAEKRSVEILIADEDKIPIVGKVGEYIFTDKIELWHYSGGGGYWGYKNVIIYDKDLEYDLFNSDKLAHAINEEVTFEVDIEKELYNKINSYEDLIIVCSTTLPGKKMSDLFTGKPEIELKNNKIYFKAKPKFYFYKDIYFSEIIGAKLDVEIPIADPLYGSNKYAIWNRYAQENWGGAFSYFDKNDPFAYAPTESGKISPAQIINASGHLVKDSPLTLMV